MEGRAGINFHATMTVEFKLEAVGPRVLPTTRAGWAQSDKHAMDDSALFVILALLRGEIKEPVVVRIAHGLLALSAPPECPLRAGVSLRCPVMAEFTECRLRF